MQVGVHRWWLEEGPAGHWECCVSGDAFLHFPCVEVTLRAKSTKIEGPGTQQCCFLGGSPGSPKVVISSLPDCTQHLPWRERVNFDSSP